MTASTLFLDWMQARQSRIEQVLDRYLTLDSDRPANGLLNEAMRYSTLNGGKRLRALLVYATGETFGADLDELDAAACAVELIHSYSLIHDDMPAMDDDDLRRGKPSCHKAYGEAIALLAGDALQTLAFDTLCHSPVGADQQIAMVRILSERSGHYGMAGGQAIDLTSVGQTLSIDDLQTMHELKTAALIEASLMLGCLSAGQLGDDILKPMSAFGKSMGLAFQVQDDVLDVIADTETLGKSQGSDQARNKPTYPALLGIDGAQDKANTLIDAALAILASLPYDTERLNALSHFVIRREH